MRAPLIFVTLLVGCAHEPSLAGTRSPAQQISVGSDHACTFDEGSVACWGSTRGTDAVARAIASVPGRLRALVLREAGSCAITNAGAVYCWADRGDEAARQIENVDDAVDVAVDRRRGCAVHADGRVSCWENGQPASEVAGVRDAVDVEMSFEDSCARLRDDRVMCWGPERPTSILAVEGVIDLAVGSEIWIVGANGRVHACSPKRCRPALLGIDDAVEIDAGRSHPCVRRSDGRVSCWSADRPEFAPIHPNWESPRRNHPVAIPGIDDARSLAVDDYAACVIEGDDGPRCWGDNVDFQLGDATGDRLTRPRRVAGPTDAVEVRVGLTHACAVTRGGELWCWGQRRGFDPVDARGGERSKPMRVGADVEHAWPGTLVTCAQIKDGTIRCWGGYLYEFSGTGSLSNTEDSQINIPAQADAMLDLQDLWGCSTTAVGLDCFGAAGYRDTEVVPGSPCIAWIRPQRWSIAAPDEIETNAVAIGQSHGCASGVDGRVYCWGNGSGSWSPDVPMVNHALPPLTGLAAGTNATCGLDRDGHAWCWGSDQAAATADLPPLAAIRPGAEHFCALDLDGRVWCWGANDVGQLGRGHVSRHEPPAPIPGLQRVAALHVGGSTSCAIDADADVWCWGDNARGQANAESPTQSTSALAVTPARIVHVRSVE